MERLSDKPVPTLRQQPLRGDQGFKFVVLPEEVTDSNLAPAQETQPVEQSESDKQAEEKKKKKNKETKKDEEYESEDESTDSQETELENGPGEIFTVKRYDDAGMLKVPSADEKKKDYIYAPEHRNPFYMPIRLADLKPIDKMLVEPQKGRIPDDKVYVSLRFVQDLARDQVDWSSLSELRHRAFGEDPDGSSEILEGAELRGLAFEGLGLPPKNIPLPEKIGEITKKDKSEPLDTRPRNAVVQGGGYRDGPDAAYEDTRFFQHIKTGYRTGDYIFIPVRSQHGDLILLHYNKWGRSETAQLSKLAEIKKLFFTAWSTSFKLENGDPEKAGGHRPRYSTGRLGFDLFVVPNLGKLAPHWGGDKASALTHLSKAIESINSAVGDQERTRLRLVEKVGDLNSTPHVKMSHNPFGFYSTYITEDAFDLYMKSLEKWNKADEIQNYACQPVTAIRHYPDEHREPKLKEALVNETSYKLGDGYSTTIDVELSLPKMVDAVGQRSPMGQPTAVMWQSPNTIATTGLGWGLLDKNGEPEPWRLSTGYSMAEWLHLSAFSWGGLKKRHEKNQHSSSDVPRNLVLGTSETNSLMTRFEKAWQALLRDEVLLAGNAKFWPNLKVVRNASDPANSGGAVTVFCDHIVKGKFPDSHRYSRVSRPATALEHKLADRYRYIAYSVHYSITFPKGSAILRLGPGATLDTVFYPFQRPFFHRVEAQLDTALYQRLVDGLLEDLDRKAQAQALAVDDKSLLVPMSGLGMNGGQGSKLGGFPGGKTGVSGSLPLVPKSGGITTFPAIPKPDGNMEIQKNKINMFMDKASEMKIEGQNNPFPGGEAGSQGGIDRLKSGDDKAGRTPPNKEERQVVQDKDKKGPGSKTVAKEERKQKEKQQKL